MIEHVWTIPCRVSVTDRKTNNVTLVEILEQIAVPRDNSAPDMAALIPAVFDVVTLWCRTEDSEPCEGEARLSLASPSGGVLLQLEYSVDLTESKRTRATSKLVGLPLTESGRHVFRIERRSVENRWETVASVPLEVDFVPSGSAPKSRNDARAAPSA